MGKVIRVRRCECSTSVPEELWADAKSKGWKEKYTKTGEAQYLCPKCASKLLKEANRQESQRRRQSQKKFQQRKKADGNTK